MGEWSDYFEDFPEENPANWVNGRFDPKGAQEQHAMTIQRERAQAELNGTIKRMIDDGNKRALQAKKAP